MVSVCCQTDVKASNLHMGTTTDIPPRPSPATILAKYQAPRLLVGLTSIMTPIQNTAAEPMIYQGKPNVSEPVVRFSTRSCPYTVFAPIFVGEWIDNKRCYERSQLFQANREGVDFGLGGAGVSKVLLEWLVSENATCHAGVVAGEERRNASVMA